MNKRLYFYREGDGNNNLKKFETLMQKCINNINVSKTILWLKNFKIVNIFQSNLKSLLLPPDITFSHKNTFNVISKSCLIYFRQKIGFSGIFNNLDPQKFLKISKFFKNFFIFVISVSRASSWYIVCMHFSKKKGSTGRKISNLVEKIAKS